MAKTPSRTNSPSRTQRRWLSRLQAFLVGLLVLLSSVALGAYLVVDWAEHQVFDTDNWVALVSPLPKEPVVADALGGYITTQIFASGAVQQKIEEALPDRAVFLAGPLTSQVKSVTNQAAVRLVASDVFQTIWSGANRAAMNRLLAQARGERTPLQQKLHDRFNLDLSGFSGKLRDALGAAAEAIPALQPLQEKTVQVSIDLKARPRYVQNTVRTVDFLAKVLPWAIIAGFLWAFALAHQKLRIVTTSLVAVAVIVLLELIALKVGQQTVVDQVKVASNVPAVTHIYEVITAGLRSNLLWALGLTVLGALVCLLVSPFVWARQLRSMVRLDKLGNTTVAAWILVARKWVGRYEYYIWLGLLLLVLIIAAFVMNSLSSAAAINAGLILLSLWAAVHIFARSKSAA